jgi:AmmeMemoRadiSam system protein A
MGRQVYGKEIAFMVPEQQLTESDRAFLLSLARKSIESCVNGTSLPVLDKATISPILNEQGASFVTLTYKGYLRGCVGALEPYQSLAEDVREHAVAAAFQDYRFPPVQAKEIEDIQIEISYLTRPVPLKYENPSELPRLLRPNIDGVVLRDGMRRATFLPQVWEKISDPEEFLEELCMKMGAQPDLWRRKKMDVLTYQVEEFHE